MKTKYQIGQHVIVDNRPATVENIKNERYTVKTYDGFKVIVKIEDTSRIRENINNS